MPFICGLPDLSALAQKGRQFYREQCQQGLEERLPGFIVAIEVDAGRGIVGYSIEDVLKRVRGIYPNSLFHFARVGAQAVYRTR